MTLVSQAHASDERYPLIHDLIAQQDTMVYVLGRAPYSSNTHFRAA
jgi:hypothetical protein